MTGIPTRARVAIATFVLALGVHSIATSDPATQPTTRPTVEAPDSAEDIRPILIGQTLPEIALHDADGEPFDLNAAVSEKPAILIFYRGGWCPYCTTHLGQLQAIEGELLDLGYQIIAVSPDRPEKLGEAAATHDLKYRLLSDSDMVAAAALGIAFRVDRGTVDLYKNSYNIDLEGDSGRTHHLLPVASAFVVGRDGLIHFSYVNPNYKVRLDSDVLLAAARAALKQSAGE